MFAKQYLMSSGEAVECGGHLKHKIELFEYLCNPHSQKQYLEKPEIFTVLMAHFSEKKSLGLVLPISSKTTAPLHDLQVSFQ